MSRDSGGDFVYVFFSPIRNDPKKTHKQNFGTHPVPGQSRKFVYVYVFFLSLTSEGPKGGRRKGGRGRKLSHFSFCCAFRCCVVYSPCFPVWGEEKIMTIYDAGPLAAGPLYGLLMTKSTLSCDPGGGEKLFDPRPQIIARRQCTQSKIKTFIFCYRTPGPWN